MNDTRECIISASNLTKEEVTTDIFSRLVCVEENIAENVKQCFNLLKTGPKEKQKFQVSLDAEDIQMLFRKTGKIYAGFQYVPDNEQIETVAEELLNKILKLTIKEVTAFLVMFIGQLDLMSAMGAVIKIQNRYEDAIILMCACEDTSVESGMEIMIATSCKK